MKVDGASRSYPSLIENIHANMNISIFEALYETEYNIIKWKQKGPEKCLYGTLAPITGRIIRRTY